MSQVNADTDIKNSNNLLANGVVDTDIKSQSNLLNNADTVQDVSNKVLTEVTSVAQEELNSGVQAKIPDAEELYSRSISSYIRNIKHLTDLINARNGGSYKISRKGMSRVLTSILQLPQDGLPVNLQGKEEQACFALGQRVIADRYLVTHYHIIQEKKRLQEEREKSTVDSNVTKTEEVSEQKGEENV
jgi:hypothetical protein